ncbi:MAG: cobalamin-binding protein [Gammaproteobacteria bacterium]|nr:cobalamin-binding protein [Gammaproteobacteria bacterium]
MTFIDHAGTPHPRATGSRRIVSLVPSLTELVCALGLADELVGRTGFCIHPRELVRRIPKVGGTKTVDLDAIRALTPTHLIVNVDENRLETVEALRPVVPSIIVTHPLEPLDNLPLYRLLGGIFDRDARAEALCREFMAAYAGNTSDSLRARVLYLIWREPWMTLSRDTYISRTLAAFGWHTWASPRPQRYPELALEECRGAIDRVLLSSEPYAFRERHIAEVERALPGVPVDLIDGEMVSWYGSRAIEGLHYLAQFTRERQH